LTSAYSRAYGWRYVRRGGGRRRGSRWRWRRREQRPGGGADIEAEAREGGGRGGRADGDEDDGGKPAGGEDDKAGARELGGERRRIRGAEARLHGRRRAAPRRIWVRASGGRGAAAPAGRSCARGGMRATQGRSGVLRGGGPTAPRRSGAEAGRRRRRGGVAAAQRAGTTTTRMKNWRSKSKCWHIYRIASLVPVRVYAWY